MRGIVGFFNGKVVVGGGGRRWGGGHYVSHPSFLPCCRRNF